IPHKNIIGFFLAPNYETRLVLVIQEESTRNINLYGIELSSVRKAHEITSLLGETHSPSVGESSNIAPSPTYSVSKSVNYFDQFLHENSSMINKLQKSDSSSVSPKSWNSKGKSDRGLEERRNISSTPTDSPMQNGFNRHSTWNSPKCGIRTPTKFPGIISSDIEYDWDDVMSPLRPKIPDDIDERISIGYYNDDTECDYSPKLSPKKTDHESDSSVPAPQNAWMENITYISNHPTKGSYVTSTGSVYMYVAQQTLAVQSMKELFGIPGKIVANSHTAPLNITKFLKQQRDSETRNRYYEIFKFDEGQVQELCEIIDRAHAHPLCLLVDDDSSLVRYQSSQSSLASDTEKRPELATPQQAMPTVTSSPGTEDDRGLSEEVLMEEEPLLEAAANDVSEFQMTMSPADELTVEAVENVKMEINQEVSMATPGEAETNAEVHHRSPIPKHLRSDPLFESLCQNVKEEDLWAVDMKYVDNHPQYGNQIVPNGAVYLFVAHHKYPELLIQPTGNMLNNHVPSDEDDGLNTAELEFTTKFLKRPTANGLDSQEVVGSQENELKSLNGPEMRVDGKSAKSIAEEDEVSNELS
ncbi:hypothetical protein X801_03379, partial [Opisthorchis viverrini]